MKKIELILKNPLFIDAIKKIDNYEKDRKFCKHGLSHLLDVARIAVLMNESVLLNKEVLDNEEISDNEENSDNEEISDNEVCSDNEAGSDNGDNPDIETIYAAALLHDIGRVCQYEKDIPHEEGSAELAGIILKDCGFSEEAIDEIVSAILCHNKELDESVSRLGRLLYKSDKASRNCFMCEARDECKWSEEKKNKMIIF